MQNIENLFLIAMEDEAKGIINDFKLVFSKPFILYQNKNNLLAITKVGKVNAAFVISYLIAKYKIDRLINLGFAGANGNFNVGDTYIVDKATYHDFDATIFGYKMGQVPKLPEYYQSDQSLVRKLIYPKANLFTGDRFMTEESEDNYLIDMEATALFQVAHLNNLPLISIKVVSDIIGSEKHLELYEYFEKNGSAILKNAYTKILEVF